MNCRIIVAAWQTKAAQNHYFWSISNYVRRRETKTGFENSFTSKKKAAIVFEEKYDNCFCFFNCFADVQIVEQKGKVFFVGLLHEVKVCWTFRVRSIGTIILIGFNWISSMFRFTSRIWWFLFCKDGVIRSVITKNNCCVRTITTRK